MDFLELIDSDADGLSDAEEKKLGTDPLSADTDRDGLNDLAEVKVYHTDPLDPDTDKDGISDSEEVRLGLNPLKKDKLKDIFIPHQGNDYKPYLLQSKRAIFYSLFFVGLKAIVFVFALSLPVQAFMMPDVLALQRGQILDLITQFRAEKGINILSETGKLNTSAQAKAGDMVINKYFDHTGPDNHTLPYFLSQAGYNYRVAGENLAMGFSSAEKVFNAWLKSPLHYKNIVDEEFMETGLGIDSGDYKGKNTIFIAQHFGTPAALAAAKAPEPGAASAPAPAAGKELSQVLSEKVHPPAVKISPPASKPAAPAIPAEKDRQAPAKEFSYSADQSRVFWKYDGRETVFTAKAYIKGEISQAEVYISGYPLTLNKDETEADLYSGRLTVEENIDDFFKVVIAPTIKIQDAKGNEVIDSINWYEIKIVSQTPVEKYTAARDVLPAGVTKVFNASRAVYGVGLAIFTIVLLLTILVEIKRQHPHLIVQSLAVILLLTTLLVI